MKNRRTGKLNEKVEKYKNLKIEYKEIEGKLYKKRVCDGLIRKKQAAWHFLIAFTLFKFANATKHIIKSPINLLPYMYRPEV